VRRYRALVRRVDPSRFDVVETANIPYAHLPAIERSCRRAGRPLLVTWHEFWGGAWKDYLHSPFWPLFALAERWLTRRGNVAITPSELTASRLPAAVRRRARVVPGGVWLDRLRDVTPTPDAATLVTVNRLIADKRIDLLLRALALLPRARLDVIGDGPERGALESLAGELELRERVRFRGRLDAPDDVWAAIAGARLAVQPSAREGFGLFALEALALGVPVVHVESRRSAVGEIARHGREGLQASADPTSLAVALRALLDDDGRHAAFAAAARRRAAEYDWSRQAARFEDAARDAIGSGRDSQMTP
jgi:glycosyltransferase involved in cell wall biosynthesis